MAPRHRAGSPSTFHLPLLSSSIDLQATIHAQGCSHTTSSAHPFLSAHTPYTHNRDRISAHGLVAPENSRSVVSEALRPPSQMPRPQASAYPNIDAANRKQKPCSQISAKRGSVMQHLQRYFTKVRLFPKEYVHGFSQYVPS